MVKMSDQGLVRSGYISSSHTMADQVFDQIHGWTSSCRQASTDGLATSIKVSCHMHDMLLTYEVADSNVQDPAVPPALIEVGQHVLECQLHELKPNGQHPQQRIIPDDQRLRTYVSCQHSQKVTSTHNLSCQHSRNLTSTPNLSCQHFQNWSSSPSLSCQHSQKLTSTPDLSCQLPEGDQHAPVPGATV